MSSGARAMSFAGVYGGAEDADSAATIARALELGVTFIDTANIYGSGHSEAVVGRLMIPSHFCRSNQGGGSAPSSCCSANIDQRA